MNAILRTRSSNQVVAAWSIGCPVGLVVLAACVFVQLRAQADPPTFLEIGMQLLQQVFIPDTVPTTGFININAANARLNSQLQMDPGGGPISIGDSGTAAVRMELNKAYSFSWGHDRFYSGQLQFHFPACANSYAIDIYNEDGTLKQSITQLTHTLGINQGSPTFSGTMVLRNTLKVLISSSDCGCGVETEGPRLIADGESLAFAWVPGKVNLAWSIKSPALGCTIDGVQTNGLGQVVGARIKAGEEDGAVTIQAREGSCIYEGTLALVCANPGDDDDSTSAPGTSCNSGQCSVFGGNSVNNRNGPDIA